MVYELFQSAEIGETIGYPAMAEALDLDPERDRHALQMAARKAGLELEKKDRRAVDAVKNVGYRVVEPTEILGLGKRRNRKAGKQITRGAIVVNAVDLNAVDGPVRDALETLARGFAVQGEINRRFAARQQRVEQKVDELANQVSALLSVVQRDKSSGT